MPSRVTEGNVREVLGYVKRGRGWLEAEVMRRKVLTIGGSGRRDRDREPKRHPCSLRSDRRCNCHICTDAGCIIGMSEGVHGN